MKRIFIMIVSILSLLITYDLYAISAITKAPTLNNSTATTLDITWEKNPNAMGYYIYYSKVSGKNYASYGDVFSENKATITNLQPNTTYYVVITSFDTQNNESFYSPEGVFNTKSFSDKFGLTEVKSINFNELELIFNASLDGSDEAIREFKVTQNNKEIATVKETEINEKEDNKLNIIFDKDLSPGEYKLTIIYITDKTGRNIEEGIDGETKFVIPPTFNPVSNAQITPDIIDGNLVNNLIGNLVDEDNQINNPLSNINTSSEEELELNSASETPNDEKNLELNSGDIVLEDGGLAGKSMTGVMSTSEVVADGNKKLPETGPKTLIILFLAMFLSGVAFYFRKKFI